MIARIFSEKKQLIIYLFSSLSQSIFYWLLAVYIAKVSGVRELGLFSLALAIVAPLSILSSLQMRSYLITTKNLDQLPQLKFLRIIVPTLIFTITLIATYLSNLSLFIYVLPLLTIKYSEIWSETVYGLWQREGQLVKVNQSLILRYGLLTFFLFISFYFKLDKAIYTLSLISLLIAGRDFLKSPLPSVRASSMISSGLLLTLLSLSASSLLTSLLINIPRYQIEFFLNLDQLGIFSALFYFYAIPSLVVNFICQGQLKELGNNLKDKSHLLRAIWGILLMIVLYTLCLHFMGTSLISIFYSISIEWELSYSLGIGCCLWIGTISSILYYLLMSHQIYHIQLKANVLSSLVTFTSGLYLIPHFGLSGAFYSFLSGLLIQLSIYIWSFASLKK